MDPSDCNGDSNNSGELLMPLMGGADDDEHIPHVLREQDRFLPIANVAKIMKKAIPERGKIAKDAKECVQECVSEFISFVTSEAAERCSQEKRKTINGEDILFALQSLGFDNYVDPLKVFLHKYREVNKCESGANKTSTFMDQHGATINIAGDSLGTDYAQQLILTNNGNLIQIPRSDASVEPNSRTIIIQTGQQNVVHASAISLATGAFHEDETDEGEDELDELEDTHSITYDENNQLNFMTKNSSLKSIKRAGSTTNNGGQSIMQMQQQQQQIAAQANNQSTYIIMTPNNSNADNKKLF